jgi:hypothetical protein
MKSWTHEIKTKHINQVNIASCISKRSGLLQPDKTSSQVKEQTANPSETPQKAPSKSPKAQKPKTKKKNQEMWL